MLQRLLLLAILFTTFCSAQDTTRVGSELAPSEILPSAEPLVFDGFSPPDSAVRQPVRPKFIWPSVSDTSTYHLQIASDSTFQSLVYTVTIQTDTQHLCETELAADSLYLWRVGWWDAAGNATFSALRSFTVASIPSFSVEECVFFPAARGEITRASVVLRNPVMDSVTVDSVLLFHPVFGVAERLPEGIPPLDSLHFTLLFQPPSYSSFRDTLLLYTSQGVAKLPLRGDSPPPILATTVDEIGLGPSIIEDTVGTIVSIRNTGLFNNLSVARVSTRSPLFTPSYSSTGVIRPDDSLRIAVRFHVQSILPGMFGRYTDTLTVISDGGDAKIVLTGTTPPPRIGVVPGTIDFGMVGANDSAFALLQITNGSINTLRIDSITTHRASFTPGTRRGRVPRADTLVMIVAFRPQRFGPYADTLTIGNNSWTPHFRVPLTGFSPYPVLETDYERIYFGTVAVGDSAVLSVRLWNSSKSTLRIDSIQWATKNFRVNRPSLPLLLRSGEAINLPMGLFPGIVGTIHDTLVILNNSQQPRWKIPLRADGIPGEPGRLGSGRSNVYEFFPNYPNPFTSSTTFSYYLPVRSHVRLEIFSTLGQNLAAVEDGERDAGVQNVRWETSLTSGVYYCRFFARALDDPSRQFVGTYKFMIVR